MLQKTSLCLIIYLLNQTARSNLALQLFDTQLKVINLFTIQSHCLFRG
ncbi:hypothetical protein KL86APRO_10366 [uncultured Alphaproteobacteria bacterium]|uniref:Uncharacterized protein n=1 Tax=uncultured Alphaproteobacteria bacterium TaxID=91750 RepID=A0A212J1I3_9PROT|nr:hypothetical protein KL86APRO_10366 [uncultured Alphaproteobacteria bacterium]